MARFGVGASSSSLFVVGGGGDDAFRLALNIGANDLGPGPSFRFLEFDGVGLDGWDAAGLDFGVLALASLVPLSIPI